MKGTKVLKLARVLMVLVTVVFVCNLIALFFVPGMVLLQGEEGLLTALTAGENPSAMPLRLLRFFVQSWNWTLWVALEGGYQTVLAAFLLFCGACTAVLLWQARKVLATICQRNPFCRENGESMRRAAVCCFLVMTAALLRLVWGLCYYGSARFLLTYNALFCPVFLLAGLLCMVMSALFRQAAELKAENDLTI